MNWQNKVPWDGLNEWNNQVQTAIPSEQVLLSWGKDLILLSRDQAVAVWDNDATLDLHKYLANTQAKVGKTIDCIHSLEFVHVNLVTTIAAQLCGKGWYNVLFRWLNRVHKEKPGAYIGWLEAVERVASKISEYIHTIPAESLQAKAWKNFKNWIQKSIHKIEFLDVPDEVIESGHTGSVIASLYATVLENEQEAFNWFQRAIRDGDANAIVPYANVLMSRKHRGPAVKLLTRGWEELGSFACLELLMRTRFEMGDNAEGARLYSLLKLGEVPVVGNIVSYISKYDFPKDLIYFSSGDFQGDIYHSPENIEAVMAAAVKWRDTLTPGTRDFALYNLRILQVLAFEFRIHKASVAFAEYITELYENEIAAKAQGDQQSNSPIDGVLREFFQEFASSRVFEMMSESEDEEVTVDDYDLLNPEEYKNLIAAYIAYAGRFSFDSWRTEIVEIAKRFSVKYESSILRVFAQEMLTQHSRVENTLTSLGDTFREFYFQTKSAAIELLWGVENYDTILAYSIAWEYQWEHSNPTLLLHLSMASILHGAPRNFVLELLGKLEHAVFTNTSRKHFANLLIVSWFQGEWFMMMSQADLSDIDVLGVLLDAAHSGEGGLYQLLTYIASRDDFDEEYPISLVQIIKEKIDWQTQKNEPIDPSLYTLLGEANILEEHNNAWIKLFKKAMDLGCLRATQRMAEYYLYHKSHPKHALPLFEKLYEITQNERYLADIARARAEILSKNTSVMLTEKGWKYALEPIDKMDPEHPDAWVALVEIGLKADDKAFDEIVLYLAYASGTALENIGTQLLDAAVERMIYRIGQLESQEWMSENDVRKSLLYSRTMARVKCENIEHCLDYFEDILEYLSQDKNLVTTLLIDFFAQFMDKEMEPFSLPEIDNDGTLVWMSDYVTQPLAQALVVEANYFMTFFDEDPRASELYQLFADIFTEIDSKALANIFLEKSVNTIEGVPAGTKNGSFMLVPSRTLQ